MLKVTSPPKITAHYADVASPDSVNEALDEILSEHGRIDNLVTSAGFTENFDAISYPPERIQKCWAVNVDGSYHFATGVARHLIERGVPGSIAMIGSMSGAVVNVPQPQAPYNAAKAAVRQLASSFAVEWAPYNIRVNCISPGYIMTALYVLPLFDSGCSHLSLLTPRYSIARARSSMRTPSSRINGPRSFLRVKWVIRKTSWVLLPFCSVMRPGTSLARICGLMVVIL